MKILRFLIITLFVLYWSVTFIYTGPSNYIRIAIQDGLTVFQKFFYQKWAFFAPPPTSNHRLYYSFYKADGTLVVSYEALEYLSKQKKEKVPWNTREEAVDYMVNGSLINLITHIISRRDAYQAANPDMSLVKSDSIARDNVNASSFDIVSYNTLANYGKIIAQKNLDSTKLAQIDYFTFSVRQIAIPKFVNREALLTEAKTITQGVLLDSKKLDFN